MEHPEPATEEVRDTQQTTCCIVGGGPAGIMLSLLLARKGIDVTLLEAHQDFDRDFRGDTVHASTLEVLDQLGLADRVLEIPHGKMERMKVVTPEREYSLIDLRGLRTRFPYVAMVPQGKFLDFLAGECRKYPSFRLVLGANVQRLVQDDGRVRGVRYRGDDSAWHEVRAALTVAADGRFSKLRNLAGLEPVKTAPPMDVVWFRLPRRPGDSEDAGVFYIHNGRFAVMLERAEEWQVGYVILKGGFQGLRSEGIEALRTSLAALVPWVKERAEILQDWKQVTVLSVESSFVPKWYQPGLLLIGDAAHVMSPVGGIGINFAIQDAVEAANVLWRPLKNGAVSPDDLAAVQKRREGPVRSAQKLQAFLQEKIAAPALQAGQSFRPPLLLRVIAKLPILRNIPGRMIAFGTKRVRVEE